MVSRVIGEDTLERASVRDEDYPAAERGSIVAVEINGRWLTPQEIIDGLADGREGYFARFAPA
jgi:hypothetical protein